ncbi:hypothetical protein KAU51_03935 [Candidatus Parcubacteria bacterium]|nr:hypothetical protein [Candidatus Parcubacteria bacterium]
MKITESASKIVLLIMAISSVAALFFGRIEGSDFMVLTGMVFTFYFSNKGSSEDNYLDK